MKILITGASGFLGSALSRYLRACGHEVVPLVRSPHPLHGQPSWFPDNACIDLKPAADCDAVLHLAGESISGRWSRSKKQRILDSRVEGTRLLCQALSDLPVPPSVLVSASAIGFYGDRGAKVIDETVTAGSGFLTKVAAAWEEATDQASTLGIRVVRLRIGLVLSPEGGALKRMLLPFRLGLGGQIGYGGQYWSWIAMDDLQALTLFALNKPTLSGPFNAVAPRPVTNAEFTQTLARVLSRPAFIPLPERLAKLFFGEMAEETLLASTRVEPTRLLENGFKFQFSELEPALRHLLNR